MKSFVNLLILAAIVLIKIGDLTLLILNLGLKLLKKILLFFWALPMVIEKVVIAFFRIFLKPLAISEVLKNYFSNIKLPKLSLRLPRISFHIPSFPKRQEVKPIRQIVDKKVKKIKPVVIFPLPITLKLKYFIEGSIFSLIFIFLPLLTFIFLQNLPKPQELTLRQIPQTTKIYDRNGALLYQIYANENRTIIPLADIPKHLQDATIAIEDKDFYRHPGFDLAAIIRSLVENLSGKPLQGGSTITQQLIKSALLTPETKIERKVKEVILAFWTERIYNKNQILEMYFNQIPYGGTAWGIESASDVYFGKHTKDLTLSESAFLAGIPKAPTIFSPYGSSPDLWKKRQKEVLDKMVSLGFISSEKAKEAEKEELRFRPRGNSIKAPHFVMYVRDFLVKKYGLPLVEKGGLHVITSLDLKVQEEAQKIVADEVSKNAFLNLTNGASLVTNPKNGDIIAMIGSKDYYNLDGGNFNVTTGLRQPGSSIKVVTYSAALSKGFTAATILDDSPATFPDNPPYSPVNYDGKFHGRVPLRIALGNSFNVPAVKTLNKIGIDTMVNLGKEMGIKSWGDPGQYGLSITLGGADTIMVDMATVYGVLANGGRKVELNPILKVTDYQGNVLEQKGEIIGDRVLDEGVTFIISDILSDNQARVWEFGPNSPLKIDGYTVSVKTGTSDNKRDNWTLGYTQNRLVAVWVGNNNNSPMSQSLASGITGAAPIWHQIMVKLLEGTADQKPTVPFNVIQKDCLGRKEFFIRGTEDSVSCVLPPPITPTPKP